MVHLHIYSYAIYIQVDDDHMLYVVIKQPQNNNKIFKLTMDEKMKLVAT